MRLTIIADQSKITTQLTATGPPAGAPSRSKGVAHMHSVSLRDVHLRHSSGWVVAVHELEPNA
jgi:hypothetical protein